MPKIFSGPDRRAQARQEREYEAPRGKARVRSFFRNLGPGLITGAADDDPSGISTYSQAGAAFGYGMLWTALISLPMMSAVQLMCAHIGLVAKRGLASVLREHYSRTLLWFACVLLLIGNTINIAADLGGMAAAASMLTGIPSPLLTPVFTAIILSLLVFASYEAMTGVLKWLTLVLFAYIFAAFLAKPDWGDVIRGTFVPHFEMSQRFLLTFVAILGTTISPYLFFWQAAHEVEATQAHEAKRSGQPVRSLHRELRIARVDVLAGMFVSNLIMYFIILTAGATLHKAGLTDVETAQQAAQALKPIAGPAAALLFTLGLIGTGMLGVPVLAGSSAYAVAEAWDWKAGMSAKPSVARNFYAVIVLGMLAGMALNFAHLNAIRMLIWSAVVNGLLAPPLIVIILIVCNNERVMGEHKNGVWLNVLGGMAALLMTGAAVALIWAWFR